MRKWLPLLLIVIYSCSGSSSKEVKRVDQAPNKALPKLKGYYTGDFNGSPIVVYIDYQEFRNVSGSDTHKGLTRNVHGTAVWEGDEVVMDLSEPGNNPYDGRFTIRLKKPFKTASGTWTPMNKGKEVSFVLDVDTAKVQEFDEAIWDSGSYAGNDNDQVVHLDRDARTAVYQTLQGDSSHQTFKSYPGNYQLLKDSTVVFYLKGYTQDTLKMQLRFAPTGYTDDGGNGYRSFKLFHNQDTLNFVFAE